LPYPPVDRRAAAGVGRGLRQGLSRGRFLLPALGRRHLADLWRATARARRERGRLLAAADRAYLPAPSVHARLRYPARAGAGGDGATRSGRIPLRRAAAPPAAGAGLGPHRRARVERPRLVDQRRVRRLSAVPAARARDLLAP